MIESGLTPKTDDFLLAYLRDISIENLAALMAKAPVYHATIGPKTAYVLPFNFIQLERIMPDQDSIGIRVNFYLKADIEEMEACAKSFVAMSGKANGALQSANEEIMMLSID